MHKTQKHFFFQKFIKNRLNKNITLNCWWERRTFMFTVLDTNLWLGVIYGRAFPCPFNEFCCFLLGHLSRQKNLRTETTTWAHCCLKKYLILWRSAKNCWDFFPVPWNLRFSIIGLLINTQYMRYSYVVSTLKMESVHKNIIFGLKCWW